jgi:drug/metabolite transporter (DMT)-like permease
LNGTLRGSGMDYLFPVIAATIWGGNAVVTKMSAGLIAPAEIGFYRWLLAVLLLTPFVIRPLYANRAQVGRQFWKLAALGLLGGTIFQTLMYFAAPLTTALNIGIIQALMPLMAIGLVSALMAHRPGLGALIGAAVSLVGVAILVTQGHPATLLAQGLNAGDGMMLAATLSYAGYTVLLRHWQLGLPLLQSMYVQAVVATTALLPLYLFGPRHGLTMENVPLVLYAGILASLVAPLVWIHGVGKLGPARMSLFFNLVPIVTACLATVILSEHLTLYHLAGGALTLGGVAFGSAQRG